MPMYPSSTQQIAKCDVVVMVCDNKFFHGMLGVVREVYDWGAMIEVESHAYPNRMKWTLRCLERELVYIGTLANKTIPNIKPDDKVDGGKAIVSHAMDTHKYEVVESFIKPVAYIGEECKNCGKMMLVQSGTCKTCHACGSSDGGCG